MAENAYPLSWPEEGGPRTPTESRMRARFKEGGNSTISVAAATGRVLAQLRMLDASRAVISTDLALRNDGLPRSNQPEPRDPGAAVYFDWRKKRMVLACDRWQRVAMNLAAIAAHIECLRGIERYGVGSLEQAFKGYQRLEDYSEGIPWRRVLGFKDGERTDLAIVTARFRERAKELHPDLSGGDSLQMAQLNQAIADARRELASA